MIQPLNEQRKTPINQFLSLFITKILLLITLNLLFILTCIPLFTIPASITSMQKVIQRVISPSDHPANMKVYFSTFKANFIQSSLFGIPIMILMMGIGYGVYFYYLNSDSILLLVLSIFSILLFLILYTASMIAYQMLPSVELSMKALIKNSFILTFSYPKTSLFGAIISLIIVGTGVWFFPYSTPLLLLIVFSFSSFVSTFIIYPLIQKHIIKRSL